MRQIFLGARERGQVPDVIERAANVDRRGHIVFDELKGPVLIEMREVALRSGDEIVQGEDRVTFRQQTVTEMRADESSGSGDEMAHRTHSNSGFRVLQYSFP